uniref:BV6 family protein n=1 Tax=Cotesia sesamiae Kitale bracovirus TaxID=452648 RepID=S0DH21_9VIRU|nr:conserved hypothetical protein [Cotesia sesamiae Kitale bracovirus]
MSRVQSQFSIVDLLCLLPNEWREHPSGVTRKILVEEFRSHLRTYETVEGLVVNIVNSTARSQAHFCSVWFRKLDDDDVEPDLMKYYPMKILFYGEVAELWISGAPAPH